MYSSCKSSLKSFVLFLNIGPWNTIATVRGGNPTKDRSQLSRRIIASIRLYFFLEVGEDIHGETLLDKIGIHVHSVKYYFSPL